MATIANLLIKLEADAKGVTATLGGATKSLGQVESKSHSAAGALKSIITTAGGVIVAFGAMRAASAAFSFIKESVVGVNNTLEQSQIQFENLTGSSAKAAEVVQGLFKFAAETPFETAPLIEATRALLTFGVEADKIQESLRLVGDAAAGTSQGVQDVAFWFGRAKSAIDAGRPFGEAAQRLQEMGIVSAVGRQKLEDLQKSGASSKVIFEALSKEFERFDGQMKKQAETMPGLTSTITDNLQLTLADGLKPFFDGLKAGLKVIADFVQTDRFKQWGAALKEVLTDNARAIFEFATSGVQKLIDSFGFILTFVAPVIKSFELLANVVRNLRTPFSELKFEDLTATPLTDSINAAAKAAATLSIEWTSNLAPSIVDSAAKAVGATDEMTEALEKSGEAATTFGDVGVNAYNRVADAAERARQKAAAVIPNAGRKEHVAGTRAGGISPFDAAVQAIINRGENPIAAETEARALFAFDPGFQIPFAPVIVESPGVPLKQWEAAFPARMSALAASAGGTIAFGTNVADIASQIDKLTQQLAGLGGGLSAANFVPADVAARAGLSGADGSGGGRVSSGLTLPFDISPTTLTLGSRQMAEAQERARQEIVGELRNLQIQMGELLNPMRIAIARTASASEENVRATNGVGKVFTSGSFGGFVTRAVDDSLRRSRGRGSGLL